MHENKNHFHDNETPRKNTNYKCSPLIRIESIYFKSEELKYYPQVFLEKCRYTLDNGGLCIDASDESGNMPDCLISLIVNMNLIMLIVNLKSL